MQHLAKPLSERVFWVGAFDPDLRSFDIILRTPNGTSYNAYVVRGSHGVAVIDTVKESHADIFFARLESVCDYTEITAIVLNHLEPDHTGALPELVRRAPQAKVYLSAQAQLMLKALMKGEGRSHMPPLDIVPMNTDDVVRLGDRNLRILNTPYLHWPDTQCSYVEEEQILFSGDVFGCHYCDPRLFNDKAGDFRFAFEYYYQNIMRPFREHVLKALDLIEPLQLTLIAPTHGPILRHEPRHYVKRYREMATPQLSNELGYGEKSLLVFYISSYGNTEAMADAIRAGAEETESLRVSVYDLEGSSGDFFVDLVEEADAVVVGSPTINGDAVRPAWDLLSSFAQINVKGKIGGAFGSYGWSGEAVRMIEDRLRGLKFRVPLPGIKVKLVPSEDELESCRQYGRELGKHIFGRQGHREIDMSELLKAKAAA